MTVAGIVYTLSSAQHAAGRVDYLGIGLVTVSVVAIMLGLWWLSRFDGPDDERGPDGPGGSGGPPRGPNPPEPPGPAWWPEFERGFASYVESLKRPRVPTGDGKPHAP